MCEHNRLKLLRCMPLKHFRNDRASCFQDTVPRAAKFLFMYKRPGQRVLINSDGDMIVRS
jgi:hypothetical protein